MEDFLPVGSAVMLEGGEEPVVIIGFCQVTSPDKGAPIYDYCAVPYPFGLMDPSKLLLFNHKDIKEVKHKGFMDEAGMNFASKIVTITDKARKGEYDK
ncbi:MAG: DUF4176 domain-containing protein [Butyrivibrio sp.]|nr:DUF4176 domain-containing protein [Butyrivibrio sp.]